MSYIRQFLLASEDRPTSTHFYSLAFKNNGELVVIHKRDFNDVNHRKTEKHEISAGQFRKHTVNNVSLKNLVVEKLEEILPKSN